MFGRGRRLHGRPRKFGLLESAAPLAACALAVVAVSFADLADAKQGRQRPNVVQIVLDDATREMLGRETTPRIWRHLTRRGSTFTEAITTSPLCCPSRASLMTGQYAHNNGVWRVEPGYPELVEPDNVLEAWLQRAGYKTAHVGKAMSGMPDSYPFSGMPPGWDEWYGTRSHRYFRPRWWLNGRERKFGPSPRNHMTRMINRRSAGVLRRALRGRRPFFLNVAHLAPHRTKPANEGERCRGHAQPTGRLNVPFESVSPLRRPSYNELDTTDKPPMVQAWPKLDGAAELKVLTEYRCAVASLAEVDRGVGRLIRILQRKKALGRTAVILVSDNGYSWGEHRLAHTKHFAYEENLRVPLLLRLPRKLRPQRPRIRSGARVALIDLAPTILEIARAKPCVSKRRCRPLDGRSLVAAARGRTEAWHAQRAIGIELGRGDWAGERWPCRYSGVRAPAGTYIRHTQLPDEQKRCAAGSFVEVYDAVADPFQLDNVAADPYSSSELRSALEQIHARISTCSGIRGRDPVPDQGRTHCE